MPIIVTSPAPNQTLGPGYWVTFETDDPNPVAIDTRWDYGIVLEPEHGEYVIRGGHQGTKFVGKVLGQQVNEQYAFAVQYRDIPTQDAYFRVQYKLDGTTVTESTTIPIKLDMTTGVPFVMQEIIKQQASTGMTAEQAEQLQVVYQTVIPWFVWDLAGEILPELWSAIVGRIRTQPVRIACGTFDGPGNIPPPSGTGILRRWVGIEFTVIGAPPGLGIDFGAPDTTEINWGQLSRKRRLSDGLEVVEETHYESRVHASWYWGMQEPSSVDIYVLPGVLVQVDCLIQLEPVVVLASSSDAPGAPSS